MSVEVRPLSVQCNLKCHYCYEASTRALQGTYNYDRAKVLAAIDKVDSFWSLFGGEALLLRLSDLEELLSIGFAKHGHTGVQTAGNLITPRHIDLFIKYRTSVGISIDGPGPLNDIRWAGSLDATRKMTARTEWAIRELAARSKEHPWLMPSLIVTLHRGNCGPDVFARFMDWFRELDALGISWVNLHSLEMDYKAKDWALPEDEYGDRYIDLWRLQGELKTLRFLKFKEILDLLQGDDSSAVCVNRACDPWNTDAVQGIENDGSPSHCTRTNKDGTNWLPAEGSGVQNIHTTFIGHPGARHYERQLALYVTPQEVGGCKDCPFWLLCQGNCPGEGETGDWRMRSSHCGLYKRLFAEGARILKAQGVRTILDWEHRKDIEREMYRRWSTSQPAHFGDVARALAAAPTGTSTEHYHHDGAYEHGDRPHADGWANPSQHGDHDDHADVPHGDAPHGDHTDHALTT